MFCAVYREGEQSKYIPCVSARRSLKTKPAKSHQNTALTRPAFFFPSDIQQQLLFYSLSLSPSVTHFSLFRPEKKSLKTAEAAYKAAAVKLQSGESGGSTQEKKGLVCVYGVG